MLTTPPDWVNLLLADLVWERRAGGLAGFMALTCAAAYRRARARGDLAAYERWYDLATRWTGRRREDLRRDGGCRGG
jgi:hypothetical protein